MDNVSGADDTYTAGLGYEYNKENDVQHQQQQQMQTTSSALLDKLQSRIETRNQLNSAKSRLLTTTDAAGHGEKADTESAQTETPPDKKQRADCSRPVYSGSSLRIEDAAEAGLNALSNCGGSRRRQMTDASVVCRNMEFSPATRGVTSRLDEIRQRFKTEVSVDD